MPYAGNWNPDHSLVLSERDPYAGHALSLEHAAYPYVEDWNTGAGGGKALLTIAGGYLKKVRQSLALPGNLVIEPTGKFTNQGPRLQLAWMPIDGTPAGIGHGARPDPRRSFWVRRKLGAGAPHSDVSLVLLAVPALVANDSNSALGAKSGLRITARVIPQQKRVGITGVACSAGLVETLGPQGPKVSPALVSFLNGDFKNDIKPRMRDAAGLAANSPLFVEGFRILSGTGDTASLEINGHIPRDPAGRRSLAYVVRARATVTAAGSITIQSLARSPLVTHQFQENLFVQDPSSFPGQHTMIEARPSRSAPELARFTVLTQLGLPGGPGAIRLTDNQIEVRQSELLGGDPTQVQTVQEPPPQARHPRTAEFAALTAYMHARALFDRMRSYGIVLDEFFRHARFPLIVRYRTSIHPGPGKDGRTINAAVDYDPPRTDFGQGMGGGQDLREPLQVRYALGDLKHSGSQRDALSMAADPRWSWHEYGHVLQAAATGGLELPFAHSLGDAMAAIACDPDSRLAADYQNGNLRGLTFPWIYAGRRHDRDVWHGWSWCGTFHRPLRLPAYTNNELRKGYHSEQILSSSLFRLYRSLGGDTVDANGNPDRAARLRAADYVLYLIMRTIQASPSAVNGGIDAPEQLVNGLIASDINTVPDPTPGAPLRNRVGGWSRKVIRWAFEAQGLYGGVGDDGVRDAPGEPLPIDVYIDDNRDRSAGQYPAGGYMPVSLHWDAQPGNELWLASAHAMNIHNQQLRVRVRNRNGTPVNRVRVRAWRATWPQAQPVPDWDPAAWHADTAVWKELPASPSPWRNIPLNGEREFPPFKLPHQAGRYLVLAALICDDDECNINPDLAQPAPTAAFRVPLIDLVPGDNNLGLRVYNA